MKKTVACIGMLAVTLLTVVALLMWPGVAASQRALNQALEVELCLSVEGAARQEAVFSAVVAPKTVMPCYAPENGVIEAVYVRPGQLVQAGEAVYKLSTIVVEKALAQTYETLEQAREREARLAAQLAENGALQALAQAGGLISRESEALASQWENLQAQLNRAIVRAPEGGTVLAVSAAAAAPVALGESVVLLYDGCKEVQAVVPQGEAEGLREGMKARLYHGGTLLAQGVLTGKNPGSAGVTLTVAPDTPLALETGEALELAVCLQETAAGVLVPLSAVTAERQVWRVYEGRAFPQDVAVVFAGEESACVQGIDPGMTLLACPPEGIRAGQRIKEGRP